MVSEANIFCKTEFAFYLLEYLKSAGILRHGCFRVVFLARIPRSFEKQTKIQMLTKC